MRAIRVHQFGPPEVMVVEEVDEPTPGPGQVVVRVRAAGVNPVDTYIRSGNYPIRPALPYTPGIDAAGVVAGVGPGVTRWKPGDRVYLGGSITGTYAEAVLCHDWQVHPLPEHISWSQGAGIHVPAATAWAALFLRGGARPGEVVLVHGASGGVGLSAVQLARAAGLSVIGTAGTPAGRELVAREGAHLVLDHHHPEHLKKAVEYTGGKGLDLILEMLANVNLGADLPALARGGRVVVVGSRGTVQIDPRDTMTREARIIGMSLMNATREELERIHAELGRALTAGTLRPVVGREMALAEAPQAHHRIITASAYGKIVLIP